MKSSVSLLILTGVCASGAALLPAFALDLDNKVTREEVKNALLERISLLGSPVSADQESAEANNDSLIETPPELPTVSAAKAKPPVKPMPTVVQVSTGEASWYGPGFFGNRTASGEVFRPGTMTAAHRSLPFGTKVRVTNLWNDRSAVVTINDRGPFVAHRVIDLAHGAAHKLGLVSSGIAQVRLEVLR
ncbi:MAG TPA: septal ring lytic transglycosylase RlpA family protein [Prochlorococcus sp.]